MAVQALLGAVSLPASQGVSSGLSLRGDNWVSPFTSVWKGHLVWSFCFSVTSEPQFCGVPLEKNVSDF